MRRSLDWLFRPRFAVSHPARRRVVTSLLAPLLVASGGCAPVTADPGTQVSMDFSRSSGLYAAPFPSDDLVKSDGTVDISAFPNPMEVTIIEQTKALITSSAHGFAQAGGVFFQLSADLDPAKLPTLAASTTTNATVFLIGVQPGTPDYLRRYPVKVVESANSSLFGPTHMLAVLPLQGQPLRPGAQYAAVVLRGALDATDHELGRSLTMAQIAAGQQPANLSTAVYKSYANAIKVLGLHGVQADTIAGLAVFTTDTPQAGFAAVVKDMLSRPTPVPGPFTLQAVYGNYCWFQSTVQIPDYQEGTPWFQYTGGNWVFDSSGKPLFQRYETANVVLTIPRTTMPAGGYPAVDFLPVGAAHEPVPLVQRGVEAGPNEDPVAPGNGPALEYAKVGFAGISIDGPQDGVRNATHNPNNEDNQMFNILNPPALRDNLREDAAEVVVHANIMANLTLDVTGCPGAGTASGSTMVHLDSTKLALQGHSMGASVAPLPAAYQPLFKAIIVDGAGASYIENIIFKQEPESLVVAAEAYLGYVTMPLLETDPALSLVQWAIEPSDSQVFARNLVQEPLNGSSPRNVLMFQGIVDTYIMPTIADALTLSLGIDVAGTTIDAGNPAYTAQDTPIMDLLTFSGRSQIAVPASGNFGKVTAVLTQDPGDGFENGHEMVFQTAPPKNQYRCFLQTYAAGQTPIVPARTSTTCP